MTLNFRKCINPFSRKIGLTKLFPIYKGLLNSTVYDLIVSIIAYVTAQEKLMIA